MKEFIKDILIAAAVVVIITLIIKPTIVKERSMEPTLYENNYLFINKLAYITADHPDYGDIIVFESNIDNDDGDGKKLLIKRVIGVENDVIDIHDGTVYRNGTAPVSYTHLDVYKRQEYSTRKRHSFFHTVLHNGRDTVFYL